MLAKLTKVREGCAFCGKPDAKLTGEHVFPQWAYELFGAETFAVEDEETIKPRTVWGGRYSRNTRRGHVVKRVCGECNSGWMAKLEGDAKPLLVPAALGRGVSLLRSGQELLAAWIMKTCLVCELTRSTPSPVVFLNSHRKRFSERLQPPKDTVIWLGAYSGAPAASFDSDHPEFRGSVNGGPSTLLSQGFSGTLTLGKLLAQVLWLGDNFPPAERRTLEVRGDWTTRTVQIWPNSGPQTFEPPAPLDDEQLHKFAKRWITK